jgi:hypothetical protein
MAHCELADVVSPPLVCLDLAHFVQGDDAKFQVPVPKTAKRPRDDMDDMLSIMGSQRGGGGGGGCSGAGSSLDTAHGHKARQHPELAKKSRPRFDGPGLRIRECLLCRRSSSSDDPVVELSFLLWAHMEGADAKTIQGFIDHYCNMLLRQRWKGWKAKDLANELVTIPATKELFEQLRDAMIEGYKNGQIRISSMQLTAPKSSVSVHQSMKEEFQVRGSLLIPRFVFLKLCGVDGESRGLKEEFHTMPDGEILSGFRVKDTGVRPLPHPDIIVINKKFEKARIFQTMVKPPC